MMKKSALLVIVLALIVSFGLGCGESEKQAGQESGPDAHTPDNITLVNDVTVPKEDNLPDSESSEPGESALPEVDTKAPEKDAPPKEETEQNKPTEGENEMPGEDKLTKEDLLAHIENNDTGLSAADFKDIDVDVFIADTLLTKKRLATVNLKNLLQSHKTRLAGKEYEAVKARDIQSVNSSDKEYGSFKSAFFKSIGAGEKHIGKNEFSIDMYSTELNSNTMYIGRTQNLNLCVVSTFPDGTLGIADSLEEETFSSQFCYSKNKKYFMLATQPFDIVKAFREIDD